MSTQRTSDFLHGLDAAAHGLSALEVQEQAGPMRRVAGPELAEVLTEQIAEAELLLGGEILLALEHAPARLLQQRLVSVARQPARFAGTNLIQGLAHLGDGCGSGPEYAGPGDTAGGSPPGRAATYRSRQTESQTSPSRPGP